MHIYIHRFHIVFSFSFSGSSKSGMASTRATVLAFFGQIDTKTNSISSATTLVSSATCLLYDHLVLAQPYSHVCRMFVHFIFFRLV